MAKKNEAEAKEQQEPKDSKEKDTKESKELKKGEETSSGFNISDFFQGTREELAKVVWPSRQQLISESVAVILMVTLSAMLIYLIDNLFRWAAQQVF
ncbi:MAG: preprotein translocase subunit SecE [Cyanobacteria bacterium RU_5_0]|nr:preprotein translocase subunit SecE [Cyanobacteria bacterium RU_5_0]